MWPEGNKEILLMDACGMFMGQSVESCEPFEAWPGLSGTTPLEGTQRPPCPQLM